MNTTNLIEAKGIHKEFVLPNDTVQALHDVSFVVPKNSFNVIYGPSGSGKSTLLNILTGLEAPTKGTITVAGQNLFDYNADERANFRARTLGMVYQTNYWVNSLSVLENVSMPLFLAGYSKHKAGKFAAESLEMVGMQDFRHQRPTVLSGGQQQRVSMARALVADPELIVADEPTGNLDTRNGDLIMNLLSDLKTSHGKTVILVTHNLEYLPLSDFRLRLKDGVVDKSSEDQSNSADVKKLREQYTSGQAPAQSSVQQSSPTSTLTEHTGPVEERVTSADHKRKSPGISGLHLDGVKRR